MLYFKALFDGLDAMPRPTPRCAPRSMRDAQREGWPALHAELARVDPRTAARLPPTDAQRIQRALEVWRIERAAAVELSCAQRRDAPTRDPPPLIALEPDDRALAARAHRRSASTRCSTPAWSTRCARCARAATCTPTCRRCAASATARPGRRSTRARRRRAERRCARRGIAATRQLAKRQLTWLRGMPQREVRRLRCAARSTAVAAALRARAPAAPRSLRRAERWRCSKSLARQALRRHAGVQRCRPARRSAASSSRSSANRASASRRC